MEFCSKGKQPNAAELKEEVKLYASMNSNITIVPPHPSAWTLQRLTEWLNEHPIAGDNNVAFINKTVAERITAEENAAKEKNKEEQALVEGVLAGAENISCSG
jgi:hypothetical protein